MRTANASLLPLLEAARAADAGANGDDGIVRRSFGITVRAINQDERSVEVVVSTDTLDAHGEVVDQDWDLKRYKKNPVVLWNHNRTFLGGPEAELPIGHSEASVKGGQLEAKIFFVDEKANPMAEKVWQGFVQRSIRAVSAGFRPHTVSREMTDDLEFYRMSNCELFEISVCPMGSNPDAVTKTQAAAQLDRLAGPKTNKASSTPVVTPKGAKKENEMELKELEDKIKALDAAAAKSAEAIATTTKALEASNAKTEELTAQVGDLTSKLAASEKTAADLTAASTKLETRAKTAENAVIKAGVEALVGKKITPAEVDEFVELATEKPELYAKMIAKREDLPTAIGTVVVGAEKTAERSTADAGNGEGLAAAIEKRRAKAS